MDEDESYEEEPSCLLHNETWRCRYQCMLNQLRQDNNSKITRDNITKISKAICTCKERRTPTGVEAQVPDERWERVTEQEFLEAEKFFENFISRIDPYSEYWSLMRYHYQLLRQTGELDTSTEGSTSARRFLLIFHRLHQNDTHLLHRQGRESMHCSVPRSQEKIHLRSLKQEYIPLFYGSHGRNLARYLRGKKKVKVEVKKENGQVYASVSCKEKDKVAIRERLTYEADKLAERRRIHEENQKEYNERNMDTDSDNETEEKSMDE